MSDFKLKVGLSPVHKRAASELYWQAFERKLSVFLGPREKALELLERIVNPLSCISAIAADGALIGIAGYKTQEGAFVGGTFRDLREVYGAWGGAWRGIGLSLLERKLEPDTLLMDGICVSASARGQGIGGALLRALKSQAAELGYSYLRLDVIDKNPRAKSLYEREGFVVTASSSAKPFGFLFGFERSDTMVFDLTATRSNENTERPDP